MPCWAASNSPARSWAAPVKAPRACPNSSLSSRRLGDGAAVDRQERSGRARRFVVDQPRDALLAGAALPGEQDGGVDLGDAPREVDEAPHARALGDDPRGLRDVAGHPHEGPAALAELALRQLEGLDHVLERDVEALLEVVRLEEAQLVGALVAPLLAGAAVEVAGRVAAAGAGVLEDADLVADRAAQVAAREAADGPADGLVGATEVEEVLFALVGGAQHDPVLGERAAAAGRDLEQPAEGVNPRASLDPIHLAVPIELGLHGLGHAPPVREAELGEYRARRGQPEAVDQILAQDAHGHGVDQQRALPREPDQAPLGVQLEQLLMTHLSRTHRCLDLPNRWNGSPSERVRIRIQSFYDAQTFCAVRRCDARTKLQLVPLRPWSDACERQK